jgi:DNA adenine methylase
MDSGGNATTAHPFLRWAGSKRKQIRRLGAFWSLERHVRYVEPFAGSACLFFSLAPTRAILSDNNQELIEVYNVVRDFPEQLYKRLNDIHRDVETYKHWRNVDPGSLNRETRALRFLYLNRNCFNGIYRTNSQGKFNVPMGRKVGAYFTEADLIRCASLLQGAQLIAGDFSETLNYVASGDFVYLDPPYALKSRRVFREYGSHVFDTSDIDRLAEGLRQVDRVKADFLVSYADCREARQLAKNWNAVRLPIRRHIAGFAGARRNAYEWLITNQSLDATAE